MIEIYNMENVFANRDITRLIHLKNAPNVLLPVELVRVLVPEIVSLVFLNRIEN
jgi:hypothetical protein